MESQKKNVFVWGTFDILHDGHREFLTRAGQYGKVHVLLMPNLRVWPFKNLYYDEVTRQKNLLETGLVENVIIDCFSSSGELKTLDKIKPDVFVFGYDQKTEWEDKLQKYLKQKGISCEVIWLEKFGEVHSSDLRRDLTCYCGSGKKHKDCHALVTPMTLCLVGKDDQILLGMKKRGFGAGRWNGFGGKVNQGEMIEEAAKREIREEAGLEVDDLEKIGVLSFQFWNKERVLDVHIFKTNNFTGEPAESEEMKPEWFPNNGIPFELMWPDDKHWMPLFLEGKKFRGRFLFGEADSILEQELVEVAEI